MTGLSIITGGLMGLAAPVVVVVAKVGANVISISRDALRATKKKVSRKATTTTYSRVGTEPQL
jgi:short-subunit dehydrogenase